MPRPTVLITEPLAQAPRDWLRERADVCDIHDTTPSDEDLRGIQALIVRTYTRVDAALLERAPNLRVVARAGVGLDNIDLDACRRAGVRVVHTPAANTEAVVEYVISTMMGALRQIATVDRPIDPATWRSQRDKAISPTSCVGTQLGIIGLGRIGSRVAQCARALSMRVAFNDLVEIDPQLRWGAEPMELSTLARTAQVLTIHVDGREENRSIFSEPFLSQLREDVILINASRGHVLDTRATIDFARAKPNARLFLDVHDPEPIPTDSPLWELPNVTLTPHIAAGTRQAKEAMSWVVRDVVRVLDGEPPHHPA